MTKDDKRILAAAKKLLKTLQEINKRQGDYFDCERALMQFEEEAATEEWVPKSTGSWTEGYDE